MSDIEARLVAASSFILQSPPGEVNDVFNDVRALVGNDDALESGILPSLEKYNVEQLVVAELPDKQQLLICEAGRVPEASNRFIEPSSAKSWIFDHLRLSASEPIDILVNQDCEAIRKELEKVAQIYGNEHFSEGVSKVFTTEQTRLKGPDTDNEVGLDPDVMPAENQKSLGTTEEAGVLKEDIIETLPDAGEKLEPVSSETFSNTDLEIVEQAQKETTLAEARQDNEMTSEPIPERGDDIEQEEIPSLDQKAEVQAESPSNKFSLYFVGNKYNPSNYWTGRWRSSYCLDLTPSEPSLTGSIRIDVHFFEQGNVQLSTSFIPSILLPSNITVSSAPEDLAKAVIKAIKKAEEEYQLELNDAYKEMSEKTFRSLRRALPVTRQKMDWAKVANYKIVVREREG